jgi:hypothetical protein
MTRAVASSSVRRSIVSLTARSIARRRPCASIGIRTMTEAGGF